MSKDISLTIEQFHDGEESQYLIKSAKEIQLTLRAIAQKKSVAVLYFDHAQRFLKSLLLAVDERGLWLDIGPNADENKLVLTSDTFTIVTMHQAAKVQFECHQITASAYADRPAFYFPFPAQMVRLQRRNFFRLPIAADTELMCVISTTPSDHALLVSLSIMDISAGGIALVCKGIDVPLEAGAIFPDCCIELPDIGTFTAAIRVKTIFDVTSESGVVTQHAGCEFVQMDGQISMLLQRYIGNMQSKLAHTDQ